MKKVKIWLISLLCIATLFIANPALADRIAKKSPDYPVIVENLNKLLALKADPQQTEYTPEALTQEISKLELQKYVLETSEDWGICRNEAGKFDLGLIEGDIKSDLKEVFYQEKIGGDRLLIVVGKQHPWFNLDSVKISDLYHTDWIMRESGSGTQQRLEEALIKWGIVPEKLKTTLIFNTGEMIKAVLENSQAAAGISELMVKKEIKLGTLKAIKIYLDRGKKNQELEMIRPFLKIKHKERFQTKVAQVFEKLLTILNYNNIE